MRKNVKKFASLILTVCIVLSLFALPFGNASAAETVQTVDVVLFSGQSNMAGFNASASDAPVDIKPGTAYQYNPTAGTITNLNEGPLYYKELTNPSITRLNTVGPVLTWCKTYYEKTGRAIVAVNGAYGGMPLWKFLPDSGLEFYGNLKSELNAAVSAVNADSTKKLGNIYLAWCQGESDIYEPDKYASRFDTLFNALKTDCGVSKAFVMNIGYPCKVSAINANQYGGYGNMQKTQLEMCAANENYVMVCDLLKYFTNYEYRDSLGIHYKQYIYNLAGEECATKMVEYLETGSKPQLSTYAICSHTNRTLIETKVYDGSTVKIGYKKYKCANPECVLNTLVVKETDKGMFYEDLVYSFDGCQHTFNNVLTDATCTEPIYRISTCTKCGMVEKTVMGDPLGHDYIETTTAATCTTAGKVVTTCSRCDYKKETVIPAAGHKYTSITVTKAATCTENGSQTGTCSVCGQTVTEVIPATGHTWGEWTVVTPATKTSTGLKKHTCSACSKEVSEVIPMLNNDIIYDWDYTDTAKGEANLNDMLSKSELANNANTGCFTYNEEGYVGVGGTKQINHYAAVFNEPKGYAPSKLTVIAHNYSIGDFVSNAGVVIGKTIYSDGTERVLQVSMNDRSWNVNGNISITDKKQVYNNDSNGISKDYTLELKAPDDSYVTKSYAKAFGVSNFKSTSSDRSDLACLTYKYDITVNKDNSVTVTVTIIFNDPDAAEGMQSVYTTTAKSITIDINTLQGISSDITGFTPAFGIAQYFTNQYNNIPAKLYSVNAVYKQTGDSETCEHKNTKTVAAVTATCTTAGKAGEVVCADCGEHISGGETINALGHDYIETRTEATCTTAGKVVTTCSRCDYKNEIVIPATGHTWGNWIEVTPATKTSVGLKKHTCSVCSKEETEVIPMLNNDIIYNWDYTDTANGATCVSETKAISEFYNGNDAELIYNNAGYCVSGSSWTYFAAVFNSPNGYKPSRFSMLSPNNADDSGYYGTAAAVIGKITRGTGDNAVITPCQVHINSTGSAAVLTVSDQANGLDRTNMLYNIALNLKDITTGEYTGSNKYSTAFGFDIATANLKYLTYKYDVTVNDDVITVTVTVTYSNPDDSKNYVTVAEPVTLSKDILQANSSTITDFTPAFGVARNCHWNARFNLDSRVYGVTAVYAQTSSSTTCEHKNTKTIAAVAATCTTAGKTEEVVCADCGAHISGGETTKALGHDYKTVTVESTCTVKGSTTTTCSRCDYKDVKELPLKNHTAAAERKDVKAATCTEEGYTGDVVCKDCGAIITKGEKISKADHTRSEWIIDTPATSTDAGSKHIECTVCGTVLETETIPATGRAYGDVNGDGVVDASDAMALLRYDALLVTLTGDSLTAADVNGDSVIDVADAVLILQYDSKAISEFPVKK